MRPNPLSRRGPRAGHQARLTSSFSQRVAVPPHNVDLDSNWRIVETMEQFLNDGRPCRRDYSKPFKAQVVSGGRRKGKDVEAVGRRRGRAHEPILRRTTAGLRCAAIDFGGRSIPGTWSKYPNDVNFLRLCRLSRWLPIHLWAHQRLRSMSWNCPKHISNRVFVLWGAAIKSVRMNE